MWPYLVTPQKIQDELGSKTLEDFEEEARVPLARKQEVIKLVRSLIFLNHCKSMFGPSDYQDFTTSSHDPLLVITPYPRRYRAELGVTNHSNHPTFIKDITVTVGTQTYRRQNGAEVVRIEPLEYRELDESFPVDDNAAPESGEFLLEIIPAIGDSITFRGSFPISRPET